MQGVTPQTRQGWDPSRLGPTAWYRSSIAWVDFGAAASVMTLKDVISPANDMAGDPVVTPQYLAQGWSGDHDVVAFSGVGGGGPFFSNTTGPIATLGTGNDVGMSMIITGTVDVISDEAFCVLLDGAGLSYMSFRVDNSGSVMRCDRNDSTGSLATISGTTPLVAGQHYRMAWVFRGLTALLYLDARLDKSTILNTGPLTLNTFKIGTGPGATDSWDGKMREVIALPRPLSAAEVLAHYNWSIANEGP